MFNLKGSNVTVTQEPTAPTDQKLFRYKTSSRTHHGLIRQHNPNQFEVEPLDGSGRPELQDYEGVQQFLEGLPADTPAEVAESR